MSPRENGDSFHIESLALMPCHSCSWLSDIDHAVAETNWDGWLWHL